MSIPPEKNKDPLQNPELVDPVIDYLGALARKWLGAQVKQMPPLPDMDLKTFLTIVEHFADMMGRVHAPFRKPGLQDTPQKAPRKKKAEEDSETTNE